VDNFGISVVVRSDNAKFKKGDVVYSRAIRWEHYAVYRPEQLSILEVDPEIPLSAYIGVLGMPGQTAYFGLREIGNLKKGETLFVTSASGAVGSVVVQLAKRAGLKVIASAGRDDKVAFLKDELGADVAFNYKTEDTLDVLKKHGPLDVYFDNVNGPSLDAALATAKSKGRIIICGETSVRDEPYAIKNTNNILHRELTVRGFVVFTFSTLPGAQEIFKAELTPLVKSGELKIKEWRTNGLKNAAQALAELYTGDNFGKALVVVDEH